MNLKFSLILKTLFTLLVLTTSQTILAQGTYTPTQENLEARQWFKDAKFGMFIHWGVYSTLGRGEWVMEVDKMSIKNYEKLPSFFNPTQFDAKEWVKLAKDAGMKYITITSRHHDGFSMFDSKLTNYDIVDATTYKKDPLKMLAEECQKEGIKLFFYYSHLDWHHPDYYPRGSTGHAAGRPDKGNWQNYVDFMNGQLTELLTNYGPIAGIWFDGWWDNKGADWQFVKQYQMIHKLQPQALIGNNHHQAPFPGEDFQMFERDLPGHNTAGYSGESEIGNLPLETCETINNTWGFNIQDDKYKSVKSIVHYLVKAAGYDANFLLNIGPMPNGKIQKEFTDTLQAVGKWLDIYGETIYGTRKGPIEPHSWGVTTSKENKVYLHILNRQDEALLLPAFGKKVKSARIFKDKSPVKIIETKEGIILKLPKKEDKEYDLVIELEM